jgi:2-dehydro-3-deoxyglucarate aldolase/4-hydroxy-2-oxoheptanedioate aldolase
VAFSISYDDYLPADVAEKMRTANEGVICGILVETEQGDKNLDTILDVAGVDLVWVGLLDLPLSLGIPGQYSHPRRVSVHRRWW